MEQPALTRTEGPAGPDVDLQRRQVEAVMGLAPTATGCRCRFVQTAKPTTTPDAATTDAIKPADPKPADPKPADTKASEELSDDLDGVTGGQSCVRTGGRG